MRRRVKNGLNTEKLHTPEQTDRIEELADLLIQISSLFEDKENMIESLRYEMEGDMSYYLALKNGKAVGYSGLEEKSLFSEQTIYWIKELGIHPEERRKGLATELLKHTMNKLREYEGREIYIDTHSENPAKTLYEKLGFQIVEKMPNLIYEM